ncbi:type I-F CRISPR-associated helicase Cas3f [Budvicia diplopodorum]|uniref:type I-F CRISPR-associated helicase Cas3f n=1 Tax=Budvicia diplopodorum TaxID=1119056 RepID=UPI0013598433|nr:type I-F CRISPR-associated helicase Cas3f [Budvicia diplopodorum]
MNVLLISQCHKKALTETRRIVDQFAERCGDRTWQTVITAQGLDTLRKLLRKTARRNTAVACYWTHGKNNTELLWVVGNRNAFNAQGRVPTNRTQRNILRKTDEESWQLSHSLQILSVLAALLHDLGKSSVGFQQKLKGIDSGLKGDPYRHEWVSMRIFQAIVGKAKTDAEWLGFLADFDAFEQRYPNWQQDILKDHIDAKASSDYAWANLPPLAQAVGWLITSHHRMPFYADNDGEENRSIVEALERHLKPVNGWVSNHYPAEAGPKPIVPFWTFNAMVTDSQSWRKSVSRWAERALRDNHLTKQISFAFFDPLLMHLARMSLMVGDHTYSGLPRHDKYGDSDFGLYANTEKVDSDTPAGTPRQRLDEHLVGVAKHAEKFSQLLPRITDSLPGIGEHRGFKKRTTHDRFAWQNKAYELAVSLREKSQMQGFFGINMASTGCGKTLGNGRIMYGLSDPAKGARFTMALGLRVLTLQTGEEYRQRMGLNEDDLAILVGGKSVVDLFNLYKRSDETGESTALSSSELNVYEQDSFKTFTEALIKNYGAGSESAMELEDGYVHYDSPIEDHHLGSVIRDAKAKKLLYAPIVTCTIDHLMGATETARGGKYIVPMLRLLSADLILDEPDDFNLEDLPALSRLVNMAGMLGSRVLLSSATLPPAMLVGLFEAYQAGRAIWNRHHGIKGQRIVCGWFDEQEPQQADCDDNAGFAQANAKFVTRRVAMLEKAPVLRQAAILSLSVTPQKNVQFDQLAHDVLRGVQTLHSAHRQPCPHTGKQVSFGLIRLSNITPLVELAQALYQSEGLADTEIHLCVYHARQLLALRSDLENQLDRILNRHQESDVFGLKPVSSVLKKAQAENVIFIVLATPVAEVGRDHDYDWAIVEPSSMRSIIQLAGRVKRHRPVPVTEPNMLIMSTNVRALKQGSNLGVKGKDIVPVFCLPGFETRSNKLVGRALMLESHKTAEILANALGHINSAPRIENPMPEILLIALEHKAVGRVMNHPEGKINLVNAWWRTSLSAGQPEVLLANPYLFYLQKETPFRKGLPQTRYVYVQNEEGGMQFENIEYPNQSEDAKFKPAILQCKGPVQPWLNQDYEVVLNQLAQKLETEDLARLARRFGFVDLDSHRLEWNYHPLLGFCPR